MNPPKPSHSSGFFAGIRCGTAGRNTAHLREENQKLWEDNNCNQKRFSTVHISAAIVWRRVQNEHLPNTKQTRFLINLLDLLNIKHCKNPKKPNGQK